jgi:hypothetical protein
MSHTKPIRKPLACLMMLPVNMNPNKNIVHLRFRLVNRANPKELIKKIAARIVCDKPTMVQVWPQN